jgi:hypothetical protein
MLLEMRVVGGIAARVWSQANERTVALITPSHATRNHITHGKR